MKTWYLAAAGSALLCACHSSDVDHADLSVRDANVSVVDFAQLGDGDAMSGNDAALDLASGAASSMMSFFVTSTGSGTTGGAFGGLTGGDQKCQALAATKGLGGKVWHAYLSDGNTDARDRIGTGPWYNFAGVQVSASVAALHMANGGIAEANILTENGTTVPAAEHAIVTGSDQSGTNANSCNDWTTNGGNNDAQLGYTDWTTTASTTDRWQSGGQTNGCSAAALTAAGSSGRIYCFAIN